MQISSRLKEWPKEQASVTVEFDLPEDHAGLVAKFGEAVVASKAVDSLVIDVQANVRRLLRAKEKYTPAQIQEKISAYKPSASNTVRRSPVEKMSDLVGKMTAEQKAELLKQLQAA